MTTHDEDKIIAQQARIEQLRNFIKHAQVSSGVCCCGDGMEGHPSPMACGHSPVDMWDYHSAQLLEAVPDDLSALRAHDAKLLAPYQWQPIETAPKGELIAIWIVGTNKNGQKWSDEEGECWLYCYHDNICGDWRTTRPSGHLRCVPDRFVTHWMSIPSAEAIEKGGV